MLDRLLETVNSMRDWENLGDDAYALLTRAAFELDRRDLVLYFTSRWKGDYPDKLESDLWLSVTEIQAGAAYPALAAAERVLDARPYDRRAQAVVAKTKDWLEAAHEREHAQDPASAGGDPP